MGSTLFLGLSVFVDPDVFLMPIMPCVFLGMSPGPASLLAVFPRPSIFLVRLSFQGVAASLGLVSLLILSLFSGPAILTV